jgi:hypothetical protein
MERYLVIRLFGKVPAGATLVQEGETYRVWHRGKPMRRIKKIDETLQVHLIRLDANIFSKAFSSLAYRSWLNEKASDIDEQGLKVYEDGLDRSPETLIMYLMDVGVNSDTLTRLMIGPGNEYAKFIQSIQ